MQRMLSFSMAEEVNQGYSNMLLEETGFADRDQHSRPQLESAIKSGAAQDFRIVIMRLSPGTGWRQRRRLSPGFLLASTSVAAQHIFLSAGNHSRRKDQIHRRDLPPTEWYLCAP